MRWERAIFNGSIDGSQPFGEYKNHQDWVESLENQQTYDIMYFFLVLGVHEPTIWCLGGFEPVGNTAKSFGLEYVFLRCWTGIYGVQSTQFSNKFQRNKALVNMDRIWYRFWPIRSEEVDRQMNWYVNLQWLGEAILPEVNVHHRSRKRANRTGPCQGNFPQE